jgi:hypothetical protein
MPQVGKGVTQDEMRATIAQAIAARDNQHRLALEAREFVRPYVGNLPALPALATDEDIYRAALKAKGVATAATMHREALRPLLEGLATRSATSSPARELAMDSSNTRSFNERFPEASRVRIQG